MGGINRTQLILILGAIVLIVLLYFAPRKTSSPILNIKENIPTASEFSFEELLDYQSKNLTSDEKLKSEKWISELKQPASRVNLQLYDSLAKLWDEKKMFALSANYYEQKANKDKTEKSYLNAAYRFFDAYKQSIDSTVRINMANKAISNYSKVTNINPKNLDAKTDLGILYAEATADPMKGIMMLREVVTEKPNHENAQLNLGFLAVRSNQYEKALQRFDKVLEINPSRLEMHIYKGQLYSQMKDKANAIECFVTFKQLSNNPQMIEQVNQYIEDLKKQ